MLQSDIHTPIQIDTAAAGHLLVVVDTEEEFDWSKPHDPTATSVRNIAEQERAHEIFDRYGIKPTYVVDYPVASKEDGYLPLRQLLEAGKCSIGAHLHPWVSPPVDEEICYRNTYPGNLPRELEMEKLKRLTDKIEENFGKRATIYKAGRYGVGANTAEILHQLGYAVDMSVVPFTDFSSDDGPDFFKCGIDPYWCGPEAQLLEIPLTLGFLGALWRFGPTLYSQMTNPALAKMRLPGIAARLRLLDRIKLTPEDISAEDHIRLTKALIRRGHRVMSFTYHSSTLLAGGSPYASTAEDVQKFLDRMDRYFDFALGKIGLRPATPLSILADAQKNREISREQ